MAKGPHRRVTQRQEKTEVQMCITRSDRIRGCLLGGAVGDALGAPIEFAELSEIQKKYGSKGLTDYAEDFGRVGAVTDDTQMSLFTAEGLIRGWVRMKTRGTLDMPAVIHHAYLRWLLTQGEEPHLALKIGEDGWLFGIRALHSQRAPGNTCLSALKDARGFGNPGMARNRSKGCGGVMRVAPVGLFASQYPGYQEAFRLGAETAALTHGHPTGYLAAGYFAAVVAALVRGEALPRAMEEADRLLPDRADSAEVSKAVRRARAVAQDGPPSPEVLESQGGGWVAEEALAISLCCALTAADFSHGVLMAVNHSGDSDSTGVITGSLLGATLGVQGISPSWLQGVEIGNEIKQIADDLDLVVGDDVLTESFLGRYPGW